MATQTETIPVTTIPVTTIPVTTLTLPLVRAYPRTDILRAPLAMRIVRSRLFPLVITIANLFVFVLVMLTGLFGTPVGNANFSIIFVWIVWWALLIMVLIPLGGRVWCTICPIPAVGEFVQRGAVLTRGRGRLWSLGKNWPAALSNIWIQNFAFLGVAIFSAVILTRPFVTGALMLGFMVVALALFLVFRRRAFCRYVCPVSGFIGLYSTVAPIELRAKDPDVCLTHCGPQGKECVKGGEDGYGCPWMEYPGTLDRNSYCGLCTECIKNCPLENVTINLRPFGTDLLVPRRRLDEAYKGLIMLAAAVIYSTVMLGPWGWLKDWANLGSGSLRHYLGYIGLFVGTTLVVVPGVFYLATAVSRRLAGARSVSVKRLFITLAYTSVPMGLAAWIAFSLTFVFVNGSYALSVVSDPFGWGWNLFGTGNYHWTPYIPQVLPYLQTPTLLVGLTLSIVLGRHLSIEAVGDRRAATLALVPVATVLTGLTVLLLWLYMG